MLRGALVFAFTYLLVATRRLRWIKVDRAGGALLGAFVALALGELTFDEAVRAVDHRTIVLLFAVMGLGGFLSVDGFFERLAPRLERSVRTRARLLGVVVWGAGLLAAVVTNDAVCVVGAPPLVAWIERWRLPRLPFLLALATGANTGSVATLVGNPQNMLCASLGGLRFAPFLLHLAPVALVGLTLNHAILHALYRRELTGELGPAAAAPADRQAAGAPLLGRRTLVVLAVLGGTVAVYLAGGDLAVTALGGFAVLLVLFRDEPEAVWARVDWSVLLFFASLFVAVDAFARSGALDYALGHLGFEPGLGSPGALARTTTFFLVGSNVVTNVPFILLVKGVVSGLPRPQLGWELLAMASTFAGNLTLLGSVANVIVAEKAERVGGLRFGEYLRAGVPIAMVTTFVGAVWLAWLHGV